MSWAEPPEPSHNVPDVRHGQIITRGHPAWLRAGDGAVWGSMAGGHNPFHSGAMETPGSWGDGSTHKFWEKMRTAEPERHHEVLAELQQGIPRLRPAVRIETPGMHGFLDDGQLRTRFHTGTGRFVSHEDYHLDLRRRADKHNFGYPEDHPATGRPVSGQLLAKPFRDSGASQYGDHTLVLSRPRLAHRTSWTSSDSLDYDNRLRPTPMTEPGLRSMLPGRVHMENAADNRLYGRIPEENIPAYYEAQLHGGVHTGDVHYAILRSRKHRYSFQPQMSKSTTELAARLTRAGIPWVHTDGHSDPGPNDPYFLPHTRSSR